MVSEAHRLCLCVGTRILVKYAAISQRSARTVVPSTTRSGCRRLDHAADAPTQGAVGRAGIGLLGGGGRAAAAAALGTLVTMRSRPTICSWYLRRRCNAMRDADVGGSGIKGLGTSFLMTVLLSTRPREPWAAATFYDFPTPVCDDDAAAIARRGAVDLYEHVRRTSEEPWTVLDG